MTMGISFVHFIFALNGITTLESFGKTLIPCAKSKHDFDQRKPDHLGYLTNLNSFFGGFYGFFWWLPMIVDDETDGK